MALCNSCKNRSSDERCTFKALPGISLCGKHCKVLKPRLWTVVHGIDKKVILISKLWKGYNIRKQIKLSGPGVMKRSLCSNNEEVSTLEDIKNIPVEDYFGFEENGKVYGFDIRTMIDICRRNLNPINPYTRQPISINDRKRLRELFAYRLRNRLPVCYENNAIESIQSNISSSWNQICQIIEENGFFNIHPNIFLQLNKSQIHVFLNMVCSDIQIWASEHKRPDSRRLKYYVWIRNALAKMNRTIDLRFYSFICASVLAMLLYDCVDSYNICFITMSALYRL